MKRLITFLAFLLPFAAFGKAAYHNKEGMIRDAEIIAIVDILKVEPTKISREGWTYNEVANAKVERVLKGELPKIVNLCGSEDFICAQVKYKPGKHLVFLRYDKDLLVGANWHLGVLPITGDSVQWFENDKSIQLKPALLVTAIEEIEKIMSNDWPVIVQVRHDSRDPVPKLKFAYWGDGTVLLRPGTGDELRVGNVGHPEFWKMWQGLREAGFFTTARESYQVPDAGYESIMVHLGNESATHNWHGVLTRGFGGDIEIDAEYRGFVEMWKKSAAAISATPTQLRPINESAKNGKFRGYVLDKPSDTEWLNPRKWKERTKGE